MQVDGQWKVPLSSLEKTGGITHNERRHDQGKTSGCLFFWKLTKGQSEKWTPRKLEIYGCILILTKFSSYIGLQPVLLLTDHRSLEHWHRELIDTPGQIGRRYRWHELLSLFDVSVEYIPGKENLAWMH